LYGLEHNLAEKTLVVAAAAAAAAAQKQREPGLSIKTLTL